MMMMMRKEGDDDVRMKCGVSEDLVGAIYLGINFLLLNYYY